MDDTPLLSVVMPAYNAERFLPQAVESILDQSFGYFEFLIIDDASTDQTPALLARYQAQDKRIHVHRQPANQGVTAALNMGLRQARGKFIARMDADDISLPRRFEKQLSYLARCPDIGVLGTGVQTINEHEQVEKRMLPSSPALTGWTMLFFNSIAHPSVMIRRDVLEALGGYNPAMRQAQDYELWLRARRMTRLTNLPEVLLLYRVWTGSVSSRLKRHQSENAASLVSDAIYDLIGERITLEEVRWLQGLAQADYPREPTQIMRTLRLLDSLLRGYLSEVTLGSAERRMIERDASLKRLLLGALALRQSPRVGLHIWAETMRTDPVAALAFVVKVGRKFGSHLLSHRGSS
ncbi:MAG: glycosyltransferase [Anaerolineae bacterium]|nr:glycosyltransferase [Anaerolineae bacterium]